LPACTRSEGAALRRGPTLGHLSARRRPWPPIGAWRTDAVPKLLPLATRDARAARLPSSFATDLTAPS